MAEHLDARIGRNLRKIRTAAGHDVETLACRIGLQPATLADYEAGRERIPVETLMLLATVLDRPVGDFFA